MPKKKTEPRQSKTAVPRQSGTVTPRQSKNVNLHVTLDAAKFRTADGGWDKQKLWDAGQQHPGRMIELTSKGDSVVYRQKNLFFDETGNIKRSFDLLKKDGALYRKGKNTQFFDMPMSNPSEAGLSKLVQEDRLVKPNRIEQEGKKYVTPEKYLKPESVKLNGPAAAAPPQSPAKKTVVKKAAAPAKPKRAKRSVPRKAPRITKLTSPRDSAGRLLMPGVLAKRVGVMKGKRFIQLGKTQYLKKSDRTSLRGAKNAKRYSDLLELKRFEKNVSRPGLSVYERRRRLKKEGEFAKRMSAGVKKRLATSVEKLTKKFDLGPRPRPARPKKELVRKPKPPRQFYRHGERFDPTSGLRLRDNQYVVRYNKTVRNSTIDRVKRRAESQRRIEAAKKLREAERAGRKAAAKRRANSRALYGKKPRPYRRDPNRFAKAMEYVSRVKKLGGYGKVPLRMLTRGTELSGSLPGKQLGQKIIGRSSLYPAMRHAATKPHPIIAGKLAHMTSVFGGQEGRHRSLSPLAQDWIHPLAGPMAGGPGGEFFSTTKTVTTQKFPAGGSGVFLRIDAEQAVHDMLVGIPAKLRLAAARLSDHIGKKLLDIVEPYVPKDTGLLYSTGRSEAMNTATGLVDIEGAEPYPHGQMLGVSISYNAPYAEIVYFDQTKRHGAAYNAKHGGASKDDRETARWVEVAFEREGAAIRSLFEEYAMALSAGLEGFRGR